MAVSFSGELAYEIHIPNQHLYAAYLALKDAAPDLHIFGARAVESMRMEKGYLHWKADILTEFDPFETGLNRFVDMSKDFVGKPALVKRQETGIQSKLVTLRIDTKACPAHPGASIMHGDKVVGTVTSGDYGHRIDMNLAYAFVKPEFAETGTKLTADLLGTIVDVEVIARSLYDPKNLRVKA
jgi:dimethylglycine dehydrogenase